MTGDLLSNLTNNGQQLGSPTLSDDGCLDEEDEELMYNEEMTLDDEDGSLSGSSYGYSYSDALSPNQAETNSQQQNSIASILGASNTANLMNNMNSMLNSVLNSNSVKQLEKPVVEENDDNAASSSPSSPESVNGSLNDEETNEK